MIVRAERTIGGKVLSIETGRLAGQANGAVTVQYGETIVLVTACMSPAPREGIDFFPLTVDYEERLYAAGKIPGGFIKREGRPSQEAILDARLTDRTIRPLFPKGFRNDVQVIVTVLSADQENNPDVLAIVGASTALSISDIPFEGPVGAVRVGWDGEQFMINPTFGELSDSQLDLVVAGTADAVVMVEAGAHEVPEDIMLEAIRVGQEANAELIQLQRELMAQVGKTKMVVEARRVEPTMYAQIAERIRERLADVAVHLTKAEREEELAGHREEIIGRYGDEFTRDDLVLVFAEEIKRQMRTKILEEGVRPDGRTPTEIRPISCAAGVLPRTHGTGLFTRGQTQVLSIVTLGSPGEEQILDTLAPEESKRFMHHYNFPPFSVGEVRRIGAVGRREIGHGALAERALEPVIPAEEDFPYTIRVVSEVLSSNGSTSMGSVCGSSLALMDTGVPIKAPVAGVAMGLIMGEGGRFEVLTDIAGMEDAMGDMDFKVAGTSAGVTALQMDIKVKGITYAVMEQAMRQAREGRLFILGKMNETIAEARPELSKYAPRMIRIHIDPDKIRFVIGPGGKTIRQITEETKCSIDIENDGSVVIGSNNEELAQKAIRMIEALTRDVEVGAIYTGKVTRTMNFGAFVEILPGKEGMVHISELADYRVPSVEDVVQVGDEIMVMVTEIDRMGRINLSRRAVLQGGREREEATDAAPPRGPVGGPRRGPGGFAERGGPPRPGAPGGPGAGPRGPRPERPAGPPSGGFGRPGGPMRGGMPGGPAGGPPRRPFDRGGPGGGPRNGGFGR
ncbi:MAG: polyribonucleotide nucleotidyltransferase [Chloroflexi bacterium]|nr:polyribonucleotide nucleotidyltransferase [Chloroflexota bacterium]